MLIPQLKGSKSLTDFVDFGTAMISSGDIDPQFWIMREYYRKKKFTTNTALWMSLLYLTYYHLGSSSIAWQLYPEPGVISDKAWNPTLIYFKQRRLFRGNRYALTHLNAVVRKTHEDLERWIEELVGNGGAEGWTRVREAYQELPYTGPWSSYKWCDIIKFVHRYPITAPDIGNKPGATAGPIAGLATLTGLKRAKCINPRIYQYLYDYVTGEFAMPLYGLDHLESVLCDWQSVTHGRYYHGLDIDRDLAQLSAYPTNEVSDTLMNLRAQIFDHRHLGEKKLDVFNFGWNGVRAELKARYSSTGELANIFKDVKKVELL